MKTSIFIFFLAVFLATCSGEATKETTTETVAIEWLGDFAMQPFVCTEDRANTGYRNTTEGKSYVCDGESWNVVAEDGVDGSDGISSSEDATDDTLTPSDLKGKAQKGPYEPDTKIVAYAYNNAWNHTGFSAPGYTESDDGSYKIHADFTENPENTFIRYEICGSNYNEVDDLNAETCLRGMFRNDGFPKNLNPLTHMQDIIAFEYMHDENHACYQNGDLCLSTAQTEILSFLGLEYTETPFSDMSLQGSTIEDAGMSFFSFHVARDKEGPEQQKTMREVANAIMSGDLAFRQQLISDYNLIPLKQTRTNLINKIGSCPPVELLSQVPAEYDQVWNHTIVETDSANADATSSCAIDVNTQNTFAYAIEGDLSEFLETELTGDVSIWSVGLCDNGTAVYNCPGTKLADVENFRESLLPGNMSFNGKFDIPLNGQYFVVESFESSTVPSHTCNGDLVPHSKNLATIDGQWNNAICYNNNALSWCKRGIKWVSYRSE